MCSLGLIKQNIVCNYQCLLILKCQTDVRVSLNYTFYYFCIFPGVLCHLLSTGCRCGPSLSPGFRSPFWPGSVGPTGDRQIRTWPGEAAPCSAGWPEETRFCAPWEEEGQSVPGIPEEKQPVPARAPARGVSSW